MQQHLWNPSPTPRAGIREKTQPRRSSKPGREGGVPMSTPLQAPQSVPCLLQSVPCKLAAQPGVWSLTGLSKHRPCRTNCSLFQSGNPALHVWAPSGSHPGAQRGPCPPGLGGHNLPLSLRTGSAQIPLMAFPASSSHTIPFPPKGLTLIQPPLRGEKKHPRVSQAILRFAASCISPWEIKAALTSQQHKRNFVFHVLLLGAVSCSKSRNCKIPT